MSRSANPKTTGFSKVHDTGQCKEELHRLWELSGSESQKMRRKVPTASWRMSTYMRGTRAMPTDMRAMRDTSG